ncbi:MAG: PDZ domain-containing protein [Bacteroidota bacterium]
MKYLLPAAFKYTGSKGSATVGFMFSAVLFLFLTMSHTISAKPVLRYTLSVTEPHSHYFDVEMRLSGLSAAETDINMAVWTPGSYLVREYAKNVEAFKAESAGAALPFDKINKHTWRIKNGKATEIVISYKVYAFELTVRNAYVDAVHAYLNPASVLMYPAGLTDLPSTLTIRPLAGWKVISTPLKPAGADKWTFSVPDWDTMVDSPIEMGNHTVLNFTSSGVEHKVAMFGDAVYDAEKLKRDMKLTTEAAASIVGEHPSPDYTFIIHNIPNGSGGLEHKNASTLQTSRFSYSGEPAYTGFLGLVAHEYFHLWNVKRIRPKALGPFDYQNENYTHMLWVSEGLTAYYDDFILRRANLISPDKYLEIVASNIGSVENTPGNRVQAVSEASWDAWIKFYRPNENSNNASVSYYTKGAVIGMLLDLEIMNATAGQKSLDDVLRYLYAEYYKKQKRGFTDSEFQQAVEKEAGKPLSDFFAKYVNGTETPDYKKYLAYVGLDMLNTNESRQDAWIGAGSRADAGRLTVTSVSRNSPAWTQGLYVNDEIIAVDNVRAAGDLGQLLAGKKPGDKIKVLISRGGFIETLDITLARNPNVNFRISNASGATAEQVALRKKWLRTAE